MNDEKGKAMKIGDEIRAWCKWCDEHSAARDELCKLADHVDSKMVELPRDKDGKAIHIGDVVYGEDGRKWLVRGIHYGETKHNGSVHQVHAVDEQRRWRDLKPEWLTHERPDRPTCRNASGYQDVFECSECKCKVELIAEIRNEYGEPFSVSFMPLFCPNCGARMVDDGR